jgi:hypothetical protein
MFWCDSARVFFRLTLPKQFGCSRRSPGLHPRLNGCIPPGLVASKGWLLLKTNTLRTLALRPINVNQ